MKFLVWAALIAVAVAESAYPTYPAYPATYNKASYDYAPQPYSYSYAIKDESTYNDYAHQETSDGSVVTGSYRVALPDGRTQIVTYSMRADSYGYTADVKYEGYVTYYDYNPTAYTPSYKTPTYPAAYPSSPIY